MVWGLKKKYRKVKKNKMKAHVALQRLLRIDPKWRNPPRRYMGRKQFMAWGSKLHPLQKTRLRRYFTCLKIHNYAEEDHQLVQALRNKREVKNHRCRIDGRRIAQDTCKFAIPQGHVVHHKDYNACNNACSNMNILSSASHRRLHKKHHRDAQCKRICRDFQAFCSK